MGKRKEKIKKGSIILSVWENEAVVNGKRKMLHNFTISRVYWEKDSNIWEFTPNFREVDLPKIKEVVEEALEKYNKGIR